MNTCHVMYICISIHKNNKLHINVCMLFRSVYKEQQTNSYILSHIHCNIIIFININQNKSSTNDFFNVLCDTWKIIITVRGSQLPLSKEIITVVRKSLMMMFCYALTPSSGAGEGMFYTTGLVKSNNNNSYD